MPADPTSSVQEADGSLTLSFHCRLCGQPSFLRGINPQRYGMYLGGAYAQDMFPELTPGQRETLISGSHEACFDGAFAADDPGLDADTVRSYLDGIVTEDGKPLLMATYETVVACPQDVERSPLWPADYDPVAIVMSAASPPEHVAIALVNLRFLTNPDESWGKCPNCGLVSPVAGTRTVCSDGCFQSYASYLTADRGTGVASRYDAGDFGEHGWDATPEPRDYDQEWP